MGRQRKFSFEFIQDKCVELGFKLLSKEWSETIKVQCKTCNNVYDKNTFNLCKFNAGCKSCKSVQANSSRKPTLLELKTVFKEGGCKLRLKDYADYINTSTPLPYRCSCSNVSKISLSNFKKGHRCADCGNIKRIRYGEDHAHWNPNKSLDKKDRDSARMSRWKRRVMLRDNFTCLACGKWSRALQAHHIYNFHSHPELRFKISNGATLCKCCHRYFHQLYGNKINTKQQLLRFIKVWSVMTNR